MPDLRLPPAVVDETSTPVRLRYFDTMLSWFEPGRLVDLGAGHGQFSLRAVDAGWTVTAVDARTVRFPDDPRVTWVHQDVRETDLTSYDMVVNLGLLYHLTLEDQISLLDRSAGRPMILDTHVGVAGEKGYRLTGVVDVDGHEGRLYSEEGIQHDPRSSWGNLASFWPTPATLQRMLAERGWDVYTAPYYLSSRTFFLCVPRDAGEDAFLAPDWLRRGADGELRRQLREERAARRAAEQRVKALEASTSWRLTALPRRLARLTRGPWG
jgi:hypothetical protein